jgi:SOS response regulatory protein OraA/RecX
VPVVTALREQPRSRVEVELDGEPWRLVPTDAVVRAGLRVGAPLDRERARLLGRELRRAKALGVAVHALRYRDHSRRSLEERLARRGVRSDAAADAVAALERAGLVDDLRVATTRAENMAARGFGDAAIRADLEQRGIGAELAAAALATLAPEPERARAVVERRGAGVKTARWLAAHGFDPSAVEESVGEAFAADG